MAVQQDPNMTAQRMYSFQKSLGSIGSVSFSERRYDGAALGNSCSVADCHIDGLEIHIASGASPLTAASVKGTVPSDWSDPRIGKLQGSNRWGVGSLQENPSWPKSASPFLADPNQDTSDDGRPYYVGVTTTWNYRSLTRFLGLDSKKITQFAQVAVNPSIGCLDPGTLCGAGFLENSASGGVVVRGTEGGGASRQCKGVKIINQNSATELAKTRDGSGLANASTTSSVVNCPVGYSGVLVGYTWFPGPSQYFQYSCASNGTTCPASPAASKPTLTCANAYRTKNGTTTLSGPSTAIEEVGSSNSRWGLRCANGWVRTGCFIGNSGTSDGADLWPDASGCISDNEEWSNASLSIVCCQVQ